MSLRWTLQFWGRQNHLEAGRYIAGHGGTLGGGQICMLLFWGEAGHRMASERRLRKDGCHASLNFLRVLKEFRYRVYF